MRRRDVAFLFRLTQKEAEAFRERVGRSGLTQEAFIRQVISGSVPRDAPPPDYYAMMKELHRIGNNLNQIALKAHTLGVVDVQRYDEEVRKFNRAVRMITEAVVLPGQGELPEQGELPGQGELSGQGELPGQGKLPGQG